MGADEHRYYQIYLRGSAWICVGNFAASCMGVESSMDLTEFVGGFPSFCMVSESAMGLLGFIGYLSNVQSIFAIFADV